MRGFRRIFGLETNYVFFSRRYLGCVQIFPDGKVCWVVFQGFSRTNLGTGIISSIYHQSSTYRDSNLYKSEVQQPGTI